MDDVCKHKWVRSGYGKDLICVKCGYAAMQAQASMPHIKSVAQPIAREKIEVPFYTGDNTVRISVYKDEWEKELKRSLGLDITHNIFNT